MISHVRRVDNGTYFTSATTESAESARLTDDDLRRLYDYPPGGAESPRSGRPWVRANFVSSIDGAATVDGKSAGLGSNADHRVFVLLRELADAVVVGAGTARTEDYGGVVLDTAARRRRTDRGMAECPPIVVVSRSADLNPRSRLFTDAAVPTIVVTGTSADERRVRTLESAGADVVRAGTTGVSAAALLEVLEDRGLRRVLCEGGPHLFGNLCADDAVDELCATMSPVLVGGDAGRITATPLSRPMSMTMEHILAEDDGTLLFRWIRPRRS